MSLSNDVNRADSPTTAIGQSGHATKGRPGRDWTVRPGGTLYEIVDHGDVLAHCWSETEARLFAAAPDLYAALAEMMEAQRVLHEPERFGKDAWRRHFTEEAIFARTRRCCAALAKAQVQR